MNKQRRKDIEIIQDKITSVLGMIDEIKCDIETILEEEQEAYENMPDGLKYSDRGYNMEYAIEALQSALDCELESDLEDCDSYLEEAKDY